jgi:4-alpha-glucanotransferase
VEKEKRCPRGELAFPNRHLSLVQAVAKTREFPAALLVKKRAMSSVRRAGVTVPLFSLRTERSWGIGEIGDLPPFAAWMKEAAGIRLVQLLPLAEISGGDTSPYAAISAFGIDPMFISLDAVPELADGGADEALGHDGRETLAHLRASGRVDYPTVRALKTRALRFAFDRFCEREARHDTDRAKSFVAFTQRESAWLVDYATFRALRDESKGAPWFDWPAPLRDRYPNDLHDARTLLATEIAWHRFAQWVAHTQWSEAREKLAAMSVEVMGDLPFMVGRDSSDVWANRGEFRGGLSVGVPPDQFNAEGQDWGLPPYAWEVMRQNDFAWLRRRAHYAAQLFDRFRLDHLVGFYRTYTRPSRPRSTEAQTSAPKLQPGTFDPAHEPDQLAHGERVIAAMRDSAAELGGALIAEDLGIVPDPVRHSLARLGVPGYKVIPWEKTKDERAFLDPADYAPATVACFGTHDTDALAPMWESLSDSDRAGLQRLPSLAGRTLGRTLDDAGRAALAELLCNAGSDLALFLIQDLVGSRERINTPATTGVHNWSYRLPAPVADLRNDAAISAALGRVRAAVAKSGR